MAKKTAEAPLGEGEFILRLINPEGETVHEERTADPTREAAYRLGVEVRNAEGPGWRYEKQGKEPEPSEPELVTRVTPRQIRLLLIELELDDMVETAIDALKGKDKKRARAEWEYASYIDRGNPLIGMIGEALSLTPEQIDEFFTSAAEL
jgi:hypothetical protein